MHIHFLRLEYENNEISQPAKDYLSINLGWAVGTALGVGYLVAFLADTLILL